MTPAEEIAIFIDEFVELWNKNRDMSSFETLVQSTKKIYPQFLVKFLREDIEKPDIRSFFDVFGKQLKNVSTEEKTLILDFGSVKIHIAPKGLSTTGLEIDLYEEAKPEKSNVIQFKPR